MLPITP